MAHPIEKARGTANHRLLLGAAALASLTGGCGSPAGTAVATNQSPTGMPATTGPASSTGTAMGGESSAAAATTGSTSSGAPAAATTGEPMMRGGSPATAIPPPTASGGTSSSTASAGSGISLPEDCSYVAPESLIVDDETQWLGAEAFEAPLGTGGYE